MLGQESRAVRQATQAQHKVFDKGENPDAATIHLCAVDGADSVLNAGSCLDSEAANLHRAVWGLKEAQPEDSAFWVVTRQQRFVLIAAGAATALSAMFAPLLTLGLFAGAAGALNIVVAGFRLWLAVLAPDAASPVPTRGGLLRVRKTWPSYTVLVPLFREAHVVPGLAQGLGRLDYPPGLVEIFLVCEADDEATVAAARAAAQADARFRVIAVPPCEPRTKPKALNFALAYAAGELCVVFDAEDRPEPDQLRQAARRFMTSTDDLACLQARLNWYNRNRNWLTRAFALEYALWFDYLLPGLERLRAPIPLGGTSNHFKTAALRRCGAWDPFNVTEDADLGLRLMRQGGIVATIPSTTYEEATSRPSAWIRQRSRWIKGYMQTWLVQMRDPVRLWRAAGPFGFLAFHLFVGGVVLTALVNPWLWLLTLVEAARWGLGAPALLGDAAALITVTSLVLGNLGLIYLNMLCVLRRGWFELVPAALMTPIYWILISVAGYRALVQLITAPFYWEKTTHGADAPA